MFMDPDTVRSIMAADPSDVADTLKYGHWVLGIDPTDPQSWAGAAQTGDDILALAIHYARSRYPLADDRDVCSFAALVQYLCTGLYGGFGTDDYPKERLAEETILRMAGGYSLPGSHWSLIPQALVECKPSPEFTQRALRVLEGLYFQGRTATEMVIEEEAS